MIKLSTGLFYPLNEEEADKLKRFGVGCTARFNITQMRNYQFHRKYFALLGIAFDLWSERMPRGQHYNFRGVDMEITPDKDRFRRDVAILCGFCTATYSANGDIKLEAKSISFANMEQEDFEKLFSKTIDVILQKIIPHANLTEKSLREWCERTLEFA